MNSLARQTGIPWRICNGRCGCIGMLGILALLSLISCSRLSSRPPSAHAPFQITGLLLPPLHLNGHLSYQIDSKQSDLRILVYRAGAMARVGHNHVIVNRLLGGWVDLAAKIADSSFALQLPVAAFEVDNAALRVEEGADFPGEIDTGSIDGTLRNMQGAALLNAANYSVILIKSVAVSGVEPTLAATVAISVAGHESRIVVPFNLVRLRDGRGIYASGNFVLRQSDLGLTPFSVLMGALQVQDEMRLKFKITALALVSR